MDSEAIVKLIEYLTGKVVQDGVEASIDIAPDCTSVRISPWKPYKMECPYGYGKERDDHGNEVLNA